MNWKCKDFCMIYGDVITAISTKLVYYEYSCAHRRLLIAGTELLTIMAHNFYSHATHKRLQCFFLGYVCSLTKYNYSYHGLNCSWHHVRELSVQYCIFTMFPEFCGEAQLTNNPGVTVIAIALS